MVLKLARPDVTVFATCSGDYVASNLFSMKRQKTFPVRLRVQRQAAVAINYRRIVRQFAVHIVDIAGKIIKTFRPRKKTVLRVSAPGNGQVTVQFRIGCVGGEGEVPATALRVKAGGYRDGFEQSGFSRAIFAYKKSDRLFKRKMVQVRVRRQWLFDFYTADIIPSIQSPGLIVPRRTWAQKADGRISYRKERNLFWEG